MSYFANYLTQRLQRLADQHPRAGALLGDPRTVREHITQRVNQGLVRSTRGWYLMAAPATLWYSPEPVLAEELVLPHEGGPPPVVDIVADLLVEFSHDVGCGGRVVAGDMFGVLGRAYKRAGWAPLCNMYLKE